MLADILFVLVLILINGVFALSEIAIISSKRVRLAQMADGGSAGARQAMTLASEPTRFLSSVQVGITSIGILNGAIGEATIAGPLRSGRQVEGIATLTDVITAIVGDLPRDGEQEPTIVRRGDGSWLLDGALDIATLVRTLEDASRVRTEERQHFHTLGGLAMVSLRRVARTGDVFDRGRYRFEVVDMDGNRVDRVLAKRIGPPDAQAVSGPE